MKQRIRLDVADRGEEINADTEFPGRAALRERILQAHASGDGVLLASLQQQHRDMRLAYTAPAVRAVPPRYRTPVRSAVSSVLRTATSAESRAYSEPEREIAGWLARWGPVVTSNDAGQSIALSTQADDLREWLSEVDPAAIPVRGDHVTLPVGSFRKFELLADGLWCVANIEESPAGDLVLAAADDGRAAGWSFGADISKCRATGWVDPDNGLPVFGGPIAIVEGSLCPSPADARCTIQLVGGQVPAYRAQVALAGAQRPALGLRAGRRTGWPAKRGWSWSR